jgi:hypothetical protein
MAKKSTFTVEQVFYIGILLLAIFLRFAFLGASPLTKTEAQAALPAFELAQGGAPSLGAQPAYVLLTSQLFSFFGSNEFLARFWPALFGAALALLPSFWRDLLSRKTAILLSLFLAIDPGLVAVSRLAAGNMFAIAALLFALTAWRRAAFVWTGVFIALALLSAPTLYLGLFAALMLWLLVYRGYLNFKTSALRPAGIAAAGVLLIGGTWFLRAPQGLSGLGNVFAGFIQGWVPGSGVEVAQLTFALVGYSFPALLFGGIGALRAWRTRDQFNISLSLWALSSFVLAFVYPGRQVADLLWGLIPLWALAAGQISLYLHLPNEERRAAFGEAGLILLLSTFFTIMLAKVSMHDFGTEGFAQYAFVAGGVLLLASLASFLVAFGWSRQAAANGLVWALSILFVLGLLSASTRFMRPGPLLANELWQPGPAAGQAALLTSSLNELSMWQLGQFQSLPVELRRDDTALRWVTRLLPPADAQEASPAVLITAMAEEQPAELSAYRGQSFAWETHRAWQAWPPNVFGWLLFRQAPTFNQEIILWARLDLFADGSTDDLADPALEEDAAESP